MSGFIVPLDYKCIKNGVIIIIEIQDIRDSLSVFPCASMGDHMHDCAHSCLCPHAYVSSHICAHTLLCPYIIVPIHDYAQTQ